MIDRDKLLELLKTQQIKQCSKTLGINLKYLECYIKNNKISVDKIKLDYAIEVLMPLSGLFNFREMSDKTGIKLRRVRYICNKYGIKSSHKYTKSEA